MYRNARIILTCAIAIALGTIATTKMELLFEVTVHEQGGLKTI